MIVVASTNGIVGIEKAVRVLKSGGSAVDAVEAGIRIVEANPSDHTAGYGGYPNLVGEVELDAGIMDGKTRTAGSVGAMKGYPFAITVARKVMDNLPHVFLVGQGAEKFAAEMGCERRDLLTEEAFEVWERRLQEDRPGEDLGRLDERNDLWEWVESAADPERAKGTVNFIAQDSRGSICAGVSTSGWAWKYPGRLGDSPVVGAGFYADDRAGAVACTGMGEMAIRAGTARTVVLLMQMGTPLGSACAHAMTDFNALGGDHLSTMSFIALDREGQHTAYSNVEGRTYIYQTISMDLPEELPRIFVETKRIWADQAAR
jgi:beta-aspartyl-peptidase (threonine type)